MNFWGFKPQTLQNQSFCWTSATKPMNLPEDDKPQQRFLLSLSQTLRGLTGLPDSFCSFVSASPLCTLLSGTALPASTVGVSGSWAVKQASQLCSVIGKFD